MDLSWVSNGQPMGSHGPPVALPLVSHKPLMGLPWVSYGSLMGFPLLKPRGSVCRVQFPWSFRKKKNIYLAFHQVGPKGTL